MWKVVESLEFDGLKALLSVITGNTNDFGITKLVYFETLTTLRSLKPKHSTVRTTIQKKQQWINMYLTVRSVNKYCKNFQV